jgi:hypothetical protein
MSLHRLHSLPWWVNTAWMWQSRREAEAFHLATGGVRTTQERLLRTTLSDNAQSRVGREHAFASLHSIDDFRSRCPVSNYDTVAPWIEQIERGDEHVLTMEPVLMFEPTGGSSGGSKLIPYTATLRRQFQRAIASWIWDLFRVLPAVRTGTAYWSISPAGQRKRETVGGMRIGFDSDQEYLDGTQRWAISRLLVVPPDVSRLHSIDNFRYATLAYLLAAEDLALISIWSPTFLTSLLDALPVWRERLCRDLHDGMLRLPSAGDEVIAPRLRIPRCPARSREIANVIGAETASNTLSGLWPRLALISCWADAAAEMYLPDLQSRFPGPATQPKGLLATEGVVSIPIVGQPGAALAIRSHFFEFLEIGDADDARTTRSHTLLADELQVKRQYRVLLTTGGGLYRYDLGDVVEVVGFLRECPLLRFRGRYLAGSDLVGEKLNERHVGECLRATFEEFDLRPDFALVVPHVAPPGYVALVVCPLGNDTDAVAAALAQRLECRLRENPQYRYAVDLRQLNPLDVRWLQLPQGRAWQIYEDHCRELGRKPGDIKPTALDGRRDWEAVFERAGASGLVSRSTR